MKVSPHVPMDDWGVSMVCPSEKTLAQFLCTGTVPDASWSSTALLEHIAGCDRCAQFVFACEGDLSFSEKDLSFRRLTHIEECWQALPVRDKLRAIVDAPNHTVGVNRKVELIGEALLSDVGVVVSLLAVKASKAIAAAIVATGDLCYDILPIRIPGVAGHKDDPESSTYIGLQRNAAKSIGQKRWNEAESLIHQIGALDVTYKGAVRIRVTGPSGQAIAEVQADVDQGYCWINCYNPMMGKLLLMPLQGQSVIVEASLHRVHGGEVYSHADLFGLDLGGLWQLYLCRGLL